MKLLTCLIVVMITQTSITFSQSIKVMSYNIRLDVASDGVNAWPKRTHKVAELIKKYNPDILGVQEALHHQLIDLLKLLPEYDYSGVGRDDGQQKGEFSAILFKKKQFKLVSDSTFWLSETPMVPGSKSWDAAITRIASIAHFSKLTSNEEFLLVNTHFDHMGKIARANSAQLITQAIASYQKEKAIPVIVTGDFNSEPTEQAYQNMLATGLLDSKPTTDNNGTFCGFEVGKIICNPIDFIFYSKDWTSRNYRVINDHDGQYYPSDHLPVMAEFVYTK